MPGTLAVASLLVVSLVLGGDAFAATRPIHPFYSSGRFQVGNGLGFPVASESAPRGPIRPVPGAVAVTAGGPTPTVMLAPAQLTAAGTPMVWRILVFGPQLATTTAAQVALPTATATFRASQFRTTTTTSLGLVVTHPNPTVTDTHVFPSGTKGTFRYTRTAHQLGGPARAFQATGHPTVFIPAGGSWPCGILTCHVAIDVVSPAPTGVFGAPFDVTNTDPGTPAVFPGVFAASITTLGVVTYLTPTGLPVPGPTNAATSAGAPWTTGMITVSVTMTPGGGTEFFTLTGSDVSTAGVRRLSLVSAGVSHRTASLSNANRGWLNLVLPEPGAAAGTAAALLTLAAGHAAARRLR